MNDRRNFPRDFPFQPKQQEDEFVHATHTNKKNGTKFVVTLLVLLLLAGAGYGLFKTFYELGSSVKGGAGIPVISASTQPYKIIPDEPGGMEIPHLDKQIYNKLDKELGAAIDMNDDSLLPLPNRDDLMAQLLEEEANKEQINSTIRKKNSVPNIPIIKETEDIEIKLDENPPKTDEVKAKRIDVEKVLAKKNLDEIWVQLGTFKAEDEATKAWQEVRESNADIFGDVGIRVTKSESDKGIYYRLQSGPIYNEDDARDLCKKLNARQQSCFYVNTKGTN